MLSLHTKGKSQSRVLRSGWGDGMMGKVLASREDVSLDTQTQQAVL